MGVQISRAVRDLVRRPLFWAVLLTLLYLVGLATRVSPYLFGPEEWRWRGRPPSPTTFPRWWPALVLLALYLLFAFWVDGREVRHRSGRREAFSLAFLVLMAPLIQVALVYIHNPYPVVA
ncbi:MAG TPA: hypothetical protein ENK56_05505, partial [Chloroflexi bacterium]|nr:hypothetical protein [Chloroflexota bacterium]